MLIKIKPDIFESSDFKGLNFLIQLLTWNPQNSIPRYHILIDYQRIENTSNYQALSDLDKKLIQDEFDYAVTESLVPDYHVTNNNNESHTFNIEEAVLFFNQAVLIVLENSLNDSYFLKAICHHFEDRNIEGKQVLPEFIKNRWIQFVNAGGWTNIRNYITGLEQSFQDLAARTGKELHTYVRCFVLIDSDKAFATDDVAKKEELKEELELKNVKAHILRKRAMENYMPDEATKKSVELPIMREEDHGAWVKVYNILTNEQKDYLNYPKGFPNNKLRTEQVQDIQDLFPNPSLSDTNYEILNKGARLKDFKNRFPELFEHPLVHKASLLAREGGTPTENEFLEIIEKLRMLI